MPMSPFIHRFPELGADETRTITTAGLQDLPADEYALLELYCDERRTEAAGSLARHRLKGGKE